MEAQVQGIKNEHLEAVIKEMSARREKECFLRKWDNHQSVWKKWSLNSSPKPFSHSLPKVTTLTFNVLFDTVKGSPIYREDVIYSFDRYCHIIKRIGQILPDVIAFNEVTSRFEAMLMDTEWVRKQYWMSQLHVKERGFKIGMIGNIILTKREPIFFDKIRADRLPREIEMIVLPISSEEGKVDLMAFGAVHLTAYKGNIDRRQRQFNDLMKYLDRYKQFVTEFVLQGDFNFHRQEEKFIFEPTHLRDAWTQVHDLKVKPGYTFNSDENTLINQIYCGFERRCMRLDRILYTGSIVKCQSIDVTFNQPVFVDKSEGRVNHHMFIKGGLMFASFALGLNFFKKEKESYLYPSDHFGLMATFTKRQK